MCVCVCVCVYISSPRLNEDEFPVHSLLQNKPANHCSTINAS